MLRLVAFHLWQFLKWYILRVSKKYAWDSTPPTHTKINETLATHSLISRYAGMFGDNQLLSFEWKFRKTLEKSREPWTFWIGWLSRTFEGAVSMSSNWVYLNKNLGKRRHQWFTNLNCRIASCNATQPLDLWNFNILKTKNHHIIHPKNGGCFFGDESHGTKINKKITKHIQVNERTASNGGVSGAKNKHP